MLNKHQQTASPEVVVTLPEGLIGLPAMRRWLLKEPDTPMPLSWLESLDRSGFRLPVIDPWYFQDGIIIDLNDYQEDLIGHPSAADVVVMIVSQIHPGGETVTGNLAAPLVFHLQKRLGVQCLCDERKYSLHQEIDYVRFGADVANLHKDAVLPGGVDLGLEEKPTRAAEYATVDESVLIDS